MSVSKAQLHKIALSFPETHEKPSYGRLSYFVAKKFFTRLREEDNSLVFVVGSLEQRDMMLELDPETYHITAHYKDYPAILVRMGRISPKELRVMLERRWRQIAPKTVLKASAAKAAAKTVSPKSAAAPRKKAASRTASHR